MFGARTLLHQAVFLRANCPTAGLWVTMRGETRAQSGLDRLILFVVFLVVIVAVLPFVFGLGGIDVRGTNAGGSGPAAGEPAADDGVVVLGATGETGGFGEDTVGVVRVVVTKNGSGPAIDTSTMTATWVGQSGSYALTTAGSGGSGDGEFGVNVTGPSDSETMLNQSGDRAILTFDLGTDDAGNVEEFGHRLEAGETVTLTLAADSGATTRVTLTVPGSLGGKGTVRL